jgi:tRNA acetyltransferase TAN1
MSSSSSNKKRQYKGGGNRNNNNNNNNSKQYHNNPKRGGPGVLLTAETGREKKCKFEALDILQHYVKFNNKDSSTNGDDKGGDAAEKSLSLDDEIKMLQTQSGAKKTHNFTVFETGCRGTIFLLCTVPDCQLIPSIKRAETSKEEKGKVNEKVSDDAKGEDEVEASDGPDCKRPRRDGEGDVKAGEEIEGSASTPQEIASQKETESTTAAIQGGEKSETAVTLSLPPPPPFDPIAMVKAVLSDLEQGSRKMPSSRFVTRMIPIQATCFASIPEIELTVQALIAKFLIPLQPKTFAISTKRRMCDNVKREQIINAVANLVLATSPSCKVDLDQPDVTIVVEICKTLAGISIVPKCKEAFHNFNLAVVRDKRTQKEQADAAAANAKND